MNKVYPKTYDFTEIKEGETKFLKNLKKIKLKNFNYAEPEMLEIGNIKLIKITDRELEDFSGADLKRENLDLTNVNDMLCKTKTIKEILATDISTPISELFNIDISEHFQNTLENIISMVSQSKDF